MRLFERLGEEVSCQRKINRGAAIRFIQGEEGVISKIEGLEAAAAMPGVQEVELYVREGNRIRPLENSSDRLGHVIAVGKDATEAAYNADTEHCYRGEVQTSQRSEWVSNSVSTADTIGIGGKPNM